MRALLPLLAIALFACGDNADKTTDSTTTWFVDTGTPTSTGSVTSGSGGSGSGGSGSGGSGGSGVAATVGIHNGSAIVDLLQMDWSGTETLQLITVSAGDTVCEWTWSTNAYTATPPTGTTTATGTPTATGSTTATATTSTAAIPCTDADGNACDFTFDVALTNGLQVFGDCGAFALPTDGGVYQYAYTSDFLSGGVSYGEDFLYYLPYLSPSSPARWYPVVYSGVGTVTYDDMTGAIEYSLPKTLLNIALP